jgi:signal transduction histidine kinase
LTADSVELDIAADADVLYGMVRKHWSIRFASSRRSSTSSATPSSSRPRAGVVEISVRNDAETVQVSVADTGMGIEPTELDRIFDRFYRSTTTVDAAVKGTGLGLAIAKKMIEAQDGQLSVTSTVGRGSTFTITFPRAPATLQVA